MAAPPGPGVGEKRAEIYTYEAPWLIYAVNWSVRADKPFRLAIGSFVEEYSNKVEIITLDEDRGTFPAAPQFSFTHPYPCTKILFIPDKECCKEDLVATAGDYLRIWTIREDGVQLASLLNNNKNSEFCAPLTSFDWNETNLARVGTSSLDTTCTIWDIERQVVDTQLIAHDKEVCSRNRTRTEEKEEETGQKNTLEPETLDPETPNPRR
eukprot:CAMPEP_0198686210 /NCGR_PEP_ID=MMETSP1468-20131203/14617_1 /TAXON_ID=1461545 /ORGANISM="Mantoniella sp, Strain CCMP1436" /LENGTH=209 /DNA_ID=CAMNT_0044432175 /DNA_START=321 /DNA_END=951 /DNA_ORIENTATION=+